MNTQILNLSTLNRRRRKIDLDKLLKLITPGHANVHSARASNQNVLYFFLCLPGFLGNGLCVHNADQNMPYTGSYSDDVPHDSQHPYSHQQDVIELCRNDSTSTCYDILGYTGTS